MHQKYSMCGRIGKRSPKWRWLRQGRSEDQSEDFRQNKQNKQHSWLSPICIGQAQVEEKHIKGGAKALSHGLSLPRACTLFFLSLSLSPAIF